MKKINIAELLKDCPSGMELDCTMYEDCKFLDVDINTINNSYLIRITTPCGIKYLDAYGRYNADDKAKCVIFPKGKTTWEGFVKKKPQYPKTYCECCDILGYKASYDLNNITTHDCVYDYKLQMLYRVLICRDAYWKIAGDWKPDWSDCTKHKYTIHIHCDDYVFWQDVSHYRWLSFPTQEMRDAFFENFKDLIEACKELL